VPVCAASVLDDAIVLACSHEHCNCRVLIQEECHCEGSLTSRSTAALAAPSLYRSRTDPGRQPFGTVSPTGLRMDSLLDHATSAGNAETAVISSVSLPRGRSADLGCANLPSDLASGERLAHVP
jgi:hypothetical protein